jgi:hypothetical protein
MTTFQENIVSGLNNPQCSFFVGAWLGGYVVLKFVGILFAFFVLYHLFEKLAYKPFIDWVYSKIYKDDKIIKVPPKFIDELINNRAMCKRAFKNLYLTKDDKARYKYIAIDNTSGDCFVENFKTKKEAISYLRGEDLEV